jgi:hypothetical protein
MTVHLRSRFSRPLDERRRRRAFALAAVALLVAATALTAIGRPGADTTAAEAGRRPAPVAAPRDGTARPGTGPPPFVQIGGE